MAFPDDLLEQAFHLARREKKRPKQASLRRSVSTSYYALFHLLIGEAAANWKIPDQRATLERAFEHGRMKAASEKIARNNYSAKAPSVVHKLKTVADAFVELQIDRPDADYNSSRRWSRADALDHADLATQAFITWQAIRNEPIAQEYLLSLLVKTR